jgi:DNA-binding transcriptional LysR family regulator
MSSPRAEQLPHLETFAEAAERSSFTAAAQALGLTQAAVSQRIHLLEGVLGRSLFRRRGGRVVLTEAGKRLYPYAQRILELHREARAEVTGKQEPLSGELFLAASTIPGEHLLPELLANFRERHPHVRVRVTVADSEAVLGQVERGEVHLGLVGKKSDNPHLECRPFASDRMALIVPAAHRWARRRRVSLDDFCRQPLIVREPGSGSRSCLEQALAEAGRSFRDLQVALELGSNEAIKEAVHRGLGLAVLSTHAVRADLQTGRFHALAVAELSLDRELFVVWDQRRVLPIPAKFFLDVLQQGGVRGGS